MADRFLQLLQPGARADARQLRIEKKSTGRLEFYPMKEQGVTMTCPFDSRTQRAGLQDELKELRRRLADAWWYERSLEEIQALEGMIAARTRELEALA